jgi:hypothetical protein
MLWVMPIAASAAQSDRGVFWRSNVNVRDTMIAAEGGFAAGAAVRDTMIVALPLPLLPTLPLIGAEGVCGDGGGGC